MALAPTSFPGVTAATDAQLVKIHGASSARVFFFVYCIPGAGSRNRRVSQRATGADDSINSSSRRIEHEVVETLIYSA